MALAAVVAALAGGIGPFASAPSPSPAAGPTPAPPASVDPHLADPASLTAVYRALTAAGLGIVGNSADAAVGAAEPRRRINATWAGWPLILEEYSSAAALRKASGFDPAARPGLGDPPYALAGLNILVEYGPRSARATPGAPDGPFADAAARLAEALDPVIGPLEQASVAPVPLPAPAAVPASPTSPADSPEDSPAAPPSP